MLLVQCPGFRSSPLNRRKRIKEKCMFANYFKIALRNLWKNKGYAAINIFGLACGLAVCLVITLYVFDELSYDKYNQNADRIYRVDADVKFGGNELKLTVSGDPMGATLKKDYPQVEEF